MPWRWPRQQLMMLPSYVSRQAGHLLPPLDFSVEELRHQSPDDWIDRLVHALYDRILKRRIVYEQDEVVEPGPRSSQWIRTPWELRGNHPRGTCLDLTLLFCGVCASYQLLPLIVHTGNHVLAAVCKTHVLSDPDQHRRKLYGAFTKNDPRELFSDRLRFLEEVTRGAYLPVECTGFAVDSSLPAPDGHRRHQGQLTFQAAVAAAKAHLSRDHTSFAVIDVTIAWHHWEISPAPLLPEGPQPELQMAPPPDRLSLGSQVHLVGRKSELASLHEFLRPRPEKNVDFHWGMWIAPGGQGKTRLAWHFCREAQEQGWNAGFLSSTDTFQNWGEWTATIPTLVVVDQIAHRPRSIRQALLALSHPNVRFLAPVRFLFLERPFQEDDFWLEEFVPAAFEDTSYIFQTSYFPGRTLTDVVQSLRPLSRNDLWQIMTEVLDRRAVPYPDREVTLDRLGEIDPDQRPLFALFVAQAIAEQGSDHWRQWSRTELVDSVLKREVDLWKKTLLPGTSNSADPLLHVFEHHLHCLTFTSIAGAQTTERVKRIGEFGIPTPEPVLEEWVRRMTALNEAKAPGDAEVIPRMEPDLLGEMFVLERLSGRLGRGIETKKATAKLLDIAFAIEPHSTQDFLVRCVRDFGNHPSIQMFGEIDVPEGDDANYGLLLDHVVHLGLFLKRIDRNDLAETAYSGVISRARELITRDDQQSFQNNLNHLLANGLYNRGVVRVHQKKTVSAREDYDEAISLLDAVLADTPSGNITWWQMLDLWSAALRGRAGLLAETGDNQRSLEDINRVLDHHDISAEQRAEALLLRSKIYRSAERFEEASGDCEEILKLSGAHLEEVQFLAVRELEVTLQIQANRSIGEGGVASAHRCLNRIIELCGEDVPRCLLAFLDRGVLFAKQIPPDWHRAIADFSTVIENAEAADPVFLQAKVNRCECYRGLQDYPSALEDANSVIDQSTPPNQVWIAAMFARARIHVAENRKVPARLDIEQILTHIDLESNWRGPVAQLLEATDD